ncbi:cob(I)yrinic acid a,c-diamide adenosyltransferase [Sphingomonas sp. LY160]|uniref:cob(I)yrinic acid a,c-diamide adenosyltransferase n=1 Tax=Sphingomonas sp. LY160 TaxID=3095342 RepID=UPI002ADEBE40|nr:cob(I)yrinic acid a,c-diamide adenosyltransferase [Sphingomonas sp. LY160]MEA1072538.1 cob(I)yrinic acid a,c-diamide adenosyltransferase [Sphingomonas sp. LY160]
MVKLNKIYTRTGDEGQAGLVDGSRVSKAGARIAAIGEVDEANSAIGVALATLDDGQLAAFLRRVQNEMFDLGADIATPFGTDFEEHALRIVGRQVERLEEEIDAMNAGLDPLTSFILPGGSVAVAALHLARAIVRRAERAVVALMAEEEVNPAALAYINRLSDHLFVAARHVAAGQGGDVPWRPGATRDN